MKIMIVDDCMTTRKIIGLYLKAKGFEVAFAENGIDALEKLSTEDVNMIFSDLNMPYMDGIEFLKTIRSNPSWANIPICMLTTEADEEEKERAIKAGADSYMVKPVSADDMVSVIRKLLKEEFSKGVHDA